MDSDTKILGSQDCEEMGVRLSAVVGKSLKMVGDIEDKIYKDGVLIETRVGHNLVVSQALKLIMSLIKNQSGYSGITYWAVGQGSSSWDSSTPGPTLNDVKLTSEIGRVAIPASEIKFLDGSGNETANPTNVIQITHTFGVNDCNGSWREFGIFGGNATTSADSGLMINKRNHAVINKTTDMSVERTMRFTLTLS